VRAVLGFIGALLVVALGAPDSHADVWKYTDADGVVHFTNIKPKGKKKKKWKRVIRSESSSESSSSSSRADVVPAKDDSPDRFSRYDEYIYEAADLYQIPVSLIRAVIKTESDYDPRVVSSKGARGLMQLMPAAASDMRVDNVHDPRENILGGVRYLRILANKFDGDLVLTIAAYHSGAGKVSRYMDVPPFPRVRKYVRLVLDRYYRYREAEAQ
jgi:soluble lytic murein transglycosylase-like protein